MKRFLKRLCFVVIAFAASAVALYFAGFIDEEAVRRAWTASVQRLRDAQEEVFSRREVPENDLLVVYESNDELIDEFLGETTTEVATTTSGPEFPTVAATLVGATIDDWVGTWQAEPIALSSADDAVLVDVRETKPIEFRIDRKDDGLAVYWPGGVTDVGRLQGGQLSLSNGRTLALVEKTKLVCKLPVGDFVLEVIAVPVDSQ